MKKIALTFTFVMGFALCLLAQNDSSTRLTHFNIPKNKLALEGYDVVAYHTDNQAVEGKKQFTYTHAGLVYRFDSQAHLDLFRKDPAKYEPAYGGWCAYAMGAKGEKVTIDPETFKIVEGKLYLFYHKFFTNTLTDWNKDEANLKSKADKNWKKIIEK